MYVCCLYVQGYYRRGAALTGLRRHKEAALAYLQCLAVDPGDPPISARKALAMVHVYILLTVYMIIRLQGKSDFSILCVFS